MASSLSFHRFTRTTGESIHRTGRCSASFTSICARSATSSSLRFQSSPPRQKPSRLQQLNCHRHSLPIFLYSTSNCTANLGFQSQPLFRNQQRRFLTQEFRSAIDKAVKSAPVVLFMKGTPGEPQCGFSRASVSVLALHGVDPAKFAAYNVLEDEELRKGIKEYTEWPTIPQLFIDGEFVGGCDILMGMHQDGSLAKVLAEKGVLAPTTPAAGSAPTAGSPPEHKE